MSSVRQGTDGHNGGGRMHLKGSQASTRYHSDWMDMASANTQLQSNSNFNNPFSGSALKTSFIFAQDTVEKCRQMRPTAVLIKKWTLWVVILPISATTKLLVLLRKLMFVQRLWRLDRVRVQCTSQGKVVWWKRVALEKIRWEAINTIGEWPAGSIEFALANRLSFLCSIWKRPINTGTHYGEGL